MTVTKPKGVLCFVKDDRAFFTTAPLDKQWGDDWDDAPYEHNAGTPYRMQGYEVEVVRFTPGLLLTPDVWAINLSWSVEQINQGEMPWLRNEDVVIKAGATFDEFQAALLRAGGTALMPWQDTAPNVSDWCAQEGCVHAAFGCPVWPKGSDPFAKPAFPPASFTEAADSYAADMAAIFGKLDAQIKGEIEKLRRELIGEDRA